MGRHLTSYTEPVVYFFRTSVKRNWACIWKLRHILKSDNYYYYYCSNNNYNKIITMQYVKKKNIWTWSKKWVADVWNSVNLSMSSLGVFSDECSTFLDMMNDIGIDKKQQRYIIKKMINIAIRATYYIFCCRNRSWDSPE